MQVLFWIVILLLFLVIIYQFMPSVQVYIDNKWDSIRNHSQTLTNFIDDDIYHIPTPFQPGETVTEFYNLRRRSQIWGSPISDGPDKSMPKTCMWRNGMLECINHSN
jgi:hypothetical protein